MDVLFKTQSDLLKGKDKLEQMMTDLDREKVVSWQSSGCSLDIIFLICAFAALPASVIDNLS